MANVTIYFPDAVEQKARKAARQAKLSLSRWISRQVAQSLEPAAGEWPAELLAAFGSCPDFPSIEQIRAGYGEDSPREEFPR